MPRRARQYTSAEAGSFGLDISGVGAVATGTIEQPLAFLTELIALLGAGLLVGAAQSWLRLRRGVCPRCGFRHRGYPSGPLIHPAPSAAAAGLRRTAYLMLLGLLPWATMKLVWGLGGDALGMTAEEWRRSTETSQSSELTKFFESFGIDLTVLAGLVGGVLVLALVQRWAWRIPRWLLLLPAWIGGISLPVYGISLLMLDCLTLAGVVPEPTDTGDFTGNSLPWITLFGGASFGGLGTAMALGDWSFQRRSQPVCQ